MKYSKLLGGDPADFTPAQARAAIFAENRRKVKQEGMTGDAAYNETKLLHPETFDRALQKPDDAEAALPNGAPAIPSGNAKKFSLSMLRLPPDATDDEFRVAFKANGMANAPLQAEKILTALRILAMSQQKVSAAEARDICNKRFPQLAALATGDTSALGNAETAIDKYQRAFAAELSKCGHDPARAHAAVLQKNPGLVELVKAQS